MIELIKMKYFNTIKAARDLNLFVMVWVLGTGPHHMVMVGFRDI
jgi:hypothetical protein